MIISINKCRPKMRAPLLAWAIMAFQKMLPWRNDSYSHLAIGYQSETGRMRYIDSTQIGVYSLPDESFLKKYKIVESLSLDVNAIRAGVLEWTETVEGTKYDKGQMLGLLLMCLNITTFNLFGRDWKRLTCNEVVLDFIRYFYKVDVGDPDNYDLLRTWQIVNEVKRLTNKVMQ